MPRRPHKTPTPTPTPTPTMPLRPDVRLDLRLDRLMADIEHFAQFGRNSDGGITRPALSAPDLESRKALCEAMTAVGLEVRVDGVGNIFGRRAGRETGRSVWLGSHLDTVPSGGRLDGPLGVLGAL